MAFDLSQKIKIVEPSANVDWKYGPYNDIATAKTTVIASLREKGLTVGVIESGAVVEYWWKAGTTDNDLVLKTSGAEGHTHDNKTTLDKIGESEGNPTWNGGAWPGSGGVAPTADNVNTALQGFTEGTPQDSDFLVFIGKIKITLANFKTLLATALNNTFASKTHAHAQTDITGLSTALAGKQDVLGFTPEQAGVAATLISNLKNGVSSEGDTLKKLYDLIVASYSEITVPNTNNRNAYNVTKLPTNIFVTNDGDGKWALYKCISLGSNRGNDIKISDPDLLNAVMTASQIKTAYESNADTNAFTNALLAKLNAFTATFTSELKTAYDAAVTASHSHSNKAILDAVEVAYTTAMNNKLSGIENNANNYVHPNTHPTNIIEGVDTLTGPVDEFLNKKGEFVKLNITKELLISKSTYNSIAEPAIYKNNETAKNITGHRLTTNATDFSITVAGVTYTNTATYPIALPANAELIINDVTIQTGYNVGNVIIIIE